LGRHGLSGRRSHALPQLGSTEEARRRLRTTLRRCAPEATALCINPGGNHPKAVNKERVG